MSCGCEMYDDNMGDDSTIIRADFKKAADAMGQKPEEAMEETYKALGKLLGKHEEGHSH